MRRLRSTLRLALISALIATALLLSTGGALAEGNPNETGPQPLPMAACNEGAANARSNIAPDDPARDYVPHTHTFGGELGCYHANPTYPPRTS
jgi:hypothetical protein